MSFVAAPGKVLEGRYVLREHLGHGGMGSVWRAEHAKLKTQVAIKLVAAAMVSSADAHARFRREAQVAASLESPNVVRVLDYGIEDDTPFLAMELLQGETLGARLARVGTLAPADTVRIVAQIARGISKAHQASVVHCDLKPENVFLAQIDGEEITKVLDFGIAKAPLFDPVTKTGAVLGTLQYMSPEQLEGRKGIGAPSDLYSLAVIVFECMCGRPAFKADSIAELVRRICGAPLPLPSEIANVAAGFDAWFLRAAHRDPASRFASAREMSDALAKLLATPTSAPSLAASVRSSVALAPTMSVERTGGSLSAGYRITPNPRAQMLELELWGLWDMPMALAFEKQLRAALATMKGAPWVRLVLLKNHPPQKDEIQELKKPLMSDPALDECERAAMLVDSSLAQMQVRRLFNEGGARNVRFFTDERAARAWLQGAEAFTKRFGTERAGFSINPNALSRIMTMELWGMWDVPLANAFCGAVDAALDEMAGAPWVTLSISSRHPPQRDDVQETKSSMMPHAVSHGLVRTATIIADNPVGQMQVRRLFGNAKMPNGRVFTDETEARSWLWEAEVFDRIGGTERAGFRVHPNPHKRMMELEFWGLWDVTLAQALRSEALRAFDEMDGPYVLLSLSRRFVSPSDEVQAVHREMMGTALKRGLVRAAIVLDSALGKMQVRRLFEEAGSPPHLRFFTDEAEARVWLAEAKVTRPHPNG